MRISKDFVGGNIKVKSMSDNEVVLENEIRDTGEDWFYWAFCIENAGGKTIKFRFDRPIRVGYYGAAVSHDLYNWQWTESKTDDEGFTYTFAPDENKVYFAHHMLYHPNRFSALANELGFEVDTLCTSNKGRDVPCIEFGNGENYIIMTARHHSCESTGNYIIEGFLKEYCKNPLENYRILCVPFVDLDGVIDGDQGKSRIPHDHNRDYLKNEKPIYNSVAKIMEYASKHNVKFGFDFHSPWHCGEGNDQLFIPQKSVDKVPSLNRFGEIFENECTDDSMKYLHKWDIAPNVGWNKVGGPCFAQCIIDCPSCDIAFTLETAYFGVDGSKFSQDRAVNTGRCFYRSLRKYINMD